VIEGSTSNYGFGRHDDVEWISAIAAKVRRAVVTVLRRSGSHEHPHRSNLHILMEAADDIVRPL
jgi:hypothetical protein